MKGHVLQGILRITYLVNMENVLTAFVKIQYFIKQACIYRKTSFIALATAQAFLVTYFGNQIVSPQNLKNSSRWLKTGRTSFPRGMLSKYTI